MSVSPRQRRAVATAGVVLLAAIAAAVALNGSDDHPTADPTVDLTVDLTVGWGGGEGDPPCVYDAADETVAAHVRIDGDAPTRRQVTVTVTAFADENTSRPVGSGTRTVRVEGTVHLPVQVTIPVTKAPHVDEDGVAACRLETTY